MIVQIENNGIKKTEIKDVRRDGGRYWCVFSLNDKDAISGLLNVDRFFVDIFFKNPATRFESHDGLDAVSFHVAHSGKSGPPVNRACMFLTKNLFLIASDNPGVIEKIVERIGADTGKQVYFERLYYAFLESTTQEDAAVLEGIEQEVAYLEDRLIATNRKNCVMEIIALRKKLMGFKRNYEQTLGVLDGIRENVNELTDKKSMRYFKIHENRVNRLYHIVLNLRDYVTQVREAYQAEVDINLNSVMKLFTVITAIFLPLSLIVGWYGMNLDMPEYDWRFSYPLVIAVCVGVAAFCLLYFKRNGWFK